MSIMRYRDLSAYAERRHRNIEEEIVLPDGRRAVLHGTVSGIATCERGQGYSDDIETHIHLVEVETGPDMWTEMAEGDPMWHHVGVHVIENEEGWFSKT